MYSGVKLSITPKQQKALIAGKSTRVNKNILNGAQIVMMHKLNVDKITRNKTGTFNLTLSPGEIMATAAHHNVIPKPDNPGELSGAGLFDSIWSGIKKVGSFLKDTGIASTLADVAQGAIEPMVGTNISKGLREGLRGATGVGIKSRKSRKSKIMGSGLYL
jgi:hypothetical protein